MTTTTTTTTVLKLEDAYTNAVNGQCVHHTVLNTLRNRKQRRKERRKIEYEDTKVMSKPSVHHTGHR